MTCSNIVCPLCGTKHSIKLRNFFRDELRSIDLLQCRHCKGMYLFPQPDAELLSKQYESYFVRRSGSQKTAKVQYFKWLLENLHFSIAGKRVIELGAGEGDLVRAINAIYPSAIVHVVEPLWLDGKRNDLKCTSSVMTLEMYLASHITEKFDYVFLLDVLEHVSDPKSMIALASQNILAPGSTLVATFPNASSFGRYLLGALWPQYKLEHLYYFSEKAVEQLAQAGNLRTISLTLHKKRLSLDYLFRVGANFGPSVIKSCFSWFHRFVPEQIRERTVTFGFGEWRWVAVKELSKPDL